MTTDYKAKLQKATFELYEKGVKRKYSHTVVFKILRLFGFEVRLPAYSEPKSVLVYTGVYFAVLIALLYGYVQWKSNGINLPILLFASIFFGGLAGMMMMWLTDYKQKKFELTPWEEL